MTAGYFYHREASFLCFLFLRVSQGPSHLFLQRPANRLLPRQGSRKVLRKCCQAESHRLLSRKRKSLHTLSASPRLRCNPVKPRLLLYLLFRWLLSPLFLYLRQAVEPSPACRRRRSRSSVLFLPALLFRKW